MNLIRLLLFLLAGWLIFRLFIAPRLKSGKTKTSKIESESMVQCAKCELHIPQAQAIQQKDLWFCCEQHHEQFVAQKKD
jgi:hypothetical protein